MERLIFIAIVLIVVGLVITLKKHLNKKRDVNPNPIYIPDNGLEKFIVQMRKSFDQFANEEDLRRYIIRHSGNLAQYPDYEQRVENLIKEFIRYKHQDQ